MPAKTIKSLQKWIGIKKDERHHIKDHCPDDVDLVDVLEMIADCTAAALARSGGLKYPLEIDKDVLYKAFENTCELELQLKSWNLRFRFCDFTI